MTFKIPSKNKVIPSSAIDLFNKLGKIERLSLQQGKSLEEYEKMTGNYKDIAIEMPAGSGKTLVGGLICEFNRINQERRVVYCCATRQLAAQTNELLKSYGINSVLLVGKVKNFSQKDYGKYKRSASVAVTTYSHIFNTNPAFKDSHLLIFDDAHATEYSINDLWTLEINKNVDKYKDVFKSLYSLVKDLIPKHIQDKIDFDVYDPTDAVDIIPQPLWIDRLEDIRAYLDHATSNTNLYYPWSKIRDYLHGCQFYISQNKLVIKPIIPPNKYHLAFNDAQERIYMSATLGAKGELERVFGVPKINRISEFTSGAEKVFGRRLILFPEDHFDGDELVNVLIESIRMQPRVLMLFPSKTILNNYKASLEHYVPEYTIFLSDDIEDSLDEFKKSEKGILLLAGRYEGIDLKDSECRMQIFVDLPVAVGVTEQFLESKLRVTEILENRLATRLIQGLGRCTRGKNDYTAVLFLGKSIGEYLYKNEFRKLLPSEIDAELEFGFEQIDNINDVTSWKESLNTFYNQGEDWGGAEEYISSQVDTKQNEREVIENQESIDEIAINEIRFQYFLIEKEYEKSNKEASEIIKILGRDNKYKSYRAWWNYNIACIFKQLGDSGKTLEFLQKAISASTNKLWLDRELFDLNIPVEDFHSIEVEHQLEQVINKLLTFGDRDIRFEKDWEKIINGLQDKKAEIFEAALNEYGSFLGLTTSRPEGKGTPDGIWNFMNYWAVFEAKTNIKDPTTAIPLEDIRQTGFHEKWLMANSQVKEDADIRVCMLCEKTYVEEYARHAADNVYLVSPTEFLAKAIQFGDILRATIQRLKHGTYDEAKKYLAINLIEQNLTIIELMEWLKNTELKNCVES